MKNIGFQKISFVGLCVRVGLHGKKSLFQRNERIYKT